MLAAAKLWRSSGTAHSNTPPSAVTSQPRSLALAGPNQTRLQSLHQTATLWRSLSCRAQAASSAHRQISQPFTAAFESGKQGRTQRVVALSTKGSQASTARTDLPLSVSLLQRPCLRGSVSSAQGSQLGGRAQRNQSQSALRALATDTGVPEKQRRPMAPLEAATFAEPESYAQQLEVKVAHVGELFSDFKLPEIEVFESAPTHYRMRAEFRVWKEDQDLYYIMFEKAEGATKSHKVRVDTFPRGSLLMNELMDRVMAAVRPNDLLRQKLYQVNFHTTISGNSMVTLIYHKKLDEEWKAAANKLRVTLAEAPSSSEDAVTIIGRSHKQKMELDRDFVIETMEVAGREYIYKQVEGAFSQPNGQMCAKMLAWALDVTRGSEGDLLELYCGNANFTVPLAQNFRRVVATEISKSSVAAAQYNMEVNDVKNIMVGRMSSEEFTEAWQAKRAVRRLEGLVWDELDMRTILVDPPRAGLDSETVQLLQRFDSIVYISCNPTTLAANLKGTIADSHEIVRFALFDQFPGTDHIECGAYLQRKAEVSVASS